MGLRWASQDRAPLTSLNSGRKGSVQKRGSTSPPPGSQRKILAGPNWGSARQKAEEVRTEWAGKCIRWVWQGFVKT